MCLSIFKVQYVDDHSGDPQLVISENLVRRYKVVSTLGIFPKTYEPTTYAKTSTVVVA